MTKSASALALVVEDDRSIQEGMRLCLEEEGFRVEIQPNGRAALDWLHSTKEHPRLIFLDLMMPVMNGYQFREEQIKDQKLALIPVIVISADGRVDQKAKSIGILKYLKKPVELTELLVALDEFR